MNNREKFLIEVQKLHILLDAITRKYDMQEEVVNIMLTGMIDTDEMGEPVLKAVYTLDVSSEELLMEAFDFLHFSFESPVPTNDELEADTWYRDILDELNDIDPSLN
jgi:hypothetical protein